VFRFWRRFASCSAASGRGRALAALKRRDFERAERELSALLESDRAAAPSEKAAARERAFLLNKRGVARAGLRRLEAAAGDFAAALDVVANYPPALTNLGNLSFEGGAFDAAIARYEAAILADPDYAVAYVNLAAAYKRAGRVDEAVRALRRAQRLDATSFLRRRRPR
jgi:tetratricopeptide (TPR) repeat protein